MKRIVAMMLVPLVSACAASCPPARVIDAGCQWVKPITASSADTLVTKRQILEHDLAYQKNCGK
jgi:hypothetical protein